MSNETDLGKQVQAIIDGELVGDEAREVLRAADLEVFELGLSLRRKRYQLESAETAVLYGARKYRPSIEAEVRRVGSFTKAYELQSAARLKDLESLLPGVPTQKR